MRLQRYFMTTPRPKKRLASRICENRACKTLFQPANKRQRFCKDQCRFAEWMTNKTRTIVTRLTIDEHAEPTIWHAVTTDPDSPPLALFRNAADAIEYGKTRARAKHQVTRIELRLAIPSKSRH